MTGADGFVGHHLVRELRRSLPSGAQLVLASRAPRESDGNSSWIRLDLTDPGSIADAVRRVRPDLVVHLAAMSSVVQSFRGQGETWSVNVSGSIMLAQAIAAYAADATTLFVSSADVYGLAFNDGLVTEACVPRPLSPYARTKAAAEAMFGDVLPSSSRLIIARPAGHSGAGQDTRFVLPGFAAQIVEAERGASPVIRVGNLKVKRHFLDVRDVTAAYVALLASAGALGNRSIFNIASDHPVQLEALLERLCSKSAIKVDIEIDRARLRSNEVPIAAIDSSAIRVGTGWKPRYSIDDLLDDLLMCFRTRPV
ncbi:GDP-mannose 4,6-dehydratase [Micromonospora sp. STR1s_5]|nr:GDP-mannose 4,6-dehydratase [Micromonospora sp. STR1s_5]